MTRNEAQLRRELIDAVPVLRRFAYSLARNAADADDLVQSTIERVLAKGAPDDAVLIKWMCRICRNLWIDIIRAKKTRQDAEPEITALSSERPLPDRETGDRQLLAKTASAIDALPDQYREVLSMIVIGGTSYREAAETLGVPVGTVMSRLARARAALAEAVQYHD